MGAQAHKHCIFLEAIEAPTMTGDVDCATIIF